MGFGADTPGGTGGKTLWVTTLADSGPGSLREAIDADGARIVRFAVSGLIELDTGLVVATPYLTLDGSDAAVALKTSADSKDTPLTIKTHDVIVRHIRSRPGPGKALSSNLDALQILGPAHDILVEHCSLSWAVDEVFSTWYDAQNITVRWCIIAEGLRNSNHSKGPHSMAALLGSAGAGNISFHHNLLAQCAERGPRINEASVGTIDVVNNVIFNAGEMVLSASANINAIGNWWLHSAAVPIQGQAAVYNFGNLSPARPSLDVPDENCCTASVTQVDAPFSAPAVPETDVYTAYEQVLEKAGAQPRDTIDARIVQAVREDDTYLIDHPDDVGGWDMTVIAVKNKVAAFELANADDIADLQANYLTANGCYFQGIILHSPLPANNEDEEPDPEVHPTDQEDDWDDFGLTLPPGMAFSLAIDAYDGPSGKGFVKRYEFTYDGDHYRRMINEGPETHLTVDWEIL